MSDQTGDAVNGLGAKLAAKVTDQLVRGHVSAKERLADHTVRVGMSLQDAFFRLTGAEMKRTAGPLWRQLAETPGNPEWAQKTFDFLAHGEGQWQTLLAGGAYGGLLAGGLGTLLTNELAPTIGNIISGNPNIRLTPVEIASADVRGLVGRIDPVMEAKQAGINEERFQLLRELNTTTLGPGEVVELYRRRALSRPQALLYLRRIGMDADHAQALLQLSRSLLTLPDAGQMWNRSILSDDELVAVALENGFTETDAHRYAELGGEPPAPTELYSAFRRGFIDADRLRRGIVQGPIRNEWFDVLEKLAMHSMTPEQAAGAITQGHLTDERGRAIAAEYGLEPDDFAVLVETAGRPPGIDFAIEAVNRGFIDQPTFDAMFLESAIKNRYLPLINRMREKLMPQETARSLLTKGVMTVDRCAVILKGHGYSDEDAASLIAAATSEKHAASKDLSLSTIRDLYAEQEISRDAAMEALQHMGYDEQESGLLLDLTDLDRERTYRNAVITRIRSGYVKGLIGVDEAGTTLDKLNVPPTRKEALIAVWDIERDTVTRDLTPAQIVAAAKKGILAPPAAQSRLVGQGYASEDASILLQLSGVQV